jgi:hypothetical protein
MTDELPGKPEAFRTGGRQSRSRHHVDRFRSVLEHYPSFGLLQLNELRSCFQEPKPHADETHGAHR